MTGYVYNADGVRVAKGPISTMSCDPTVSGLQAATETDYVLGPGGQQLMELGPDGKGDIASWTRTHVYAVGNAPLATFNRGGLYFRLTDWLGTLRVLTDFAGVTQQTCNGLPFGDGQTCTDQTEDSNYFTGKERDAESGNDYFGARYYSSALGRFLSPDWDAKPTTVPYASFGDPQTLNLYGYVENEPLNKVDADGHTAESDISFDFKDDGFSIDGTSGLTPTDECPLNADCVYAQAIREVGSEENIQYETSQSDNTAQDAANKASAATDTAQQPNKEVSTVYNETSGLRSIPDKSTDADLHDARKSTAHAYENGGNFQSIDHLSSGELTATKTYDPAKAALADSVLAVQQARKEADPTHSATIAIQFDPQNQPKQRWAHNTEVVQVFGPFNNLAGGGRGVIKGHDVYIMIMKDPNLK